MAYQGNRPAEAFSSFQKQDFTTSATTSYTLDHPVSNQNEIEWDTIFSLGTKFESNQDLKFRNHDIVFDAYSKDKGKMNLKGILVEKEPGGDESVDFKTRNIYFDIPYFVK